MVAPIPVSPDPNARCSERACPYPAVEGGLCHAHFADHNTAERSMYGSSLDGFDVARGHPEPSGGGGGHTAGWRKKQLKRGWKKNASKAMSEL